jgi:hypothetical protein
MHCVCYTVSHSYWFVGNSVQVCGQLSCKQVGSPPGLHCHVVSLWHLPFRYSGPIAPPIMFGSPKPYMAYAAAEPEDIKARHKLDEDKTAVSIRQKDRQLDVAGQINKCLTV